MWTNDVQADKLASCLLDLAELHQEVPETRLCDDTVDGKDTHAVELRGGLRVSGQMAPNDLVFLQATCWATESALSDGQYVRRHVCMFHVVRDHHYSSERKRDA